MSDLRKFCPLSVHQLVELEGGLGGAAAHPGEVARHTDVTVSPGEGWGKQGQGKEMRKWTVATDESIFT